jgi:hypothetical protein
MNRLDIEFGAIALLLLVISVCGTFAVTAAIRRRRFYRAAFVGIAAALVVLSGWYMFVCFATSLEKHFS